VTCCCRNTALMDEYIQVFQKAGIKTDKCKVYQLDLGDFKSIKKVAEAYKTDIGRLDVMINNAGIMACPLGYTKDGHEMQFGTNHLGHYLLTSLLQDLLLQSDSPRHVNVASCAHKFANSDPKQQIEFDDINSTADTYDSMRR